MTNYAARQHEARRTLVLAALALPGKPSPLFEGYTPAVDIWTRLLRVLGVYRTTDWVRRYLSDLHATGHADRRKIPGGRGTHYGWRITDGGRRLLADQLELLDDDTRTNYLTATGTPS